MPLRGHNLELRLMRIRRRFERDGDDNSVLKLCCSRMVLR